MAKIDLFQCGSIEAFIQWRMKTGSSWKLLDPLPKPVIQHGQTCKLYALSVAMGWQYTKCKGAIPIPPPARKRDISYGYNPKIFQQQPQSQQQQQEKSVASLRKQAKEKYGSKVGEVYDHRTLLALAKENGFGQSRVIASNADEYVSHLKTEIDRNNAPVVFFDVSSQGEPIDVNSEREHGAVLGGYYVEKNDQLNFILLQWGEYFHVNASELLKSAGQLSLSRKPEIFSKLWGDWSNSPLGTLIASPEDIRKANPPVSEEGTFRYKILIVAPDEAPQPKKLP